MNGGIGDLWIFDGARSLHWTLENMSDRTRVIITLIRGRDTSLNKVLIISNNPNNPNNPRNNPNNPYNPNNPNNPNKYYIYIYLYTALLVNM